VIAFGPTETAKPSTASRNRLQRTIVYAIRPTRTLSVIQAPDGIAQAWRCHIIFRYETPSDSNEKSFQCFPPFSKGTG
jgi:hypothetical protein